MTESGRIREFSTAQTLYQSPSVDFTLRFENTGNTHVHPQGNVTIYNIWGKQRGQVLINDQDASFGNVLPQSIRRFQFSWQGEQNLFDIGPYSAVVTLNYGDTDKKSVTATTYFWIVPVIPVSIGLGSILLFILLITWFIRRYVRRALMLENARFGGSSKATAPVIETLIEPFREGVIDLRSVRGKSSSPVSVQSSDRLQVADPVVGTSAVAYERSLTPYQFIVKYRLFIVFLVVCVAGVSTGWWYFAKVLESHRSFEIHNVTTANESTTKQ